MMIEFTYGKGAGKIVLEKRRKGLFKLKFRVPAKGLLHESLAITINECEFANFKELLKSRNVGKFELGKYQGIYKEYLLVERAEENDRFKIELNSWFLVSGFWFLVSGFWFLVSGFWFLVFGASLGGRIGREDADELVRLIEKHF